MRFVVPAERLVATWLEILIETTDDEREREILRDALARIEEYTA